MVFADVGVILFLTFVADTRSHDFAQTVEIVALQAQTALDFLAHVLSPRLSTEGAHAKADVVLADTHLLHGLGQVEGIRRGAGHAGDAEVANQAHMLFSITR